MFVDPLAEKFMGWTPYHYVHQNPINLIDPTGMSAEPVYDLEGNHLGNTIEGFTGDVIIYSGDKDKSFFENMTADEFLNHDEALNDVFKLDDVIDDISDDALSKIFTHVATSFISDIEFNIESVGGVIGYESSDLFNFASTWNLGTGTGNITGNRNYVGSYESTVENIGLTLINHEFKGHIKNDFGTFNNNHHKAYLEVINDSKFSKSTPKFQNYNLRRHAEYYLQERVFDR